MRWCVGIVLRFEADGGVGMDVITGCVEQYGGQVGFYRQAAARGGLGQPGGLHHVVAGAAAAVTEALTGAGLWGVEFFLSRDNGVYFSELSPRPHDTGMVTLAGTQNLNEFELHLRAVLGIPIPAVTFERMGASAVILSGVETSAPRYGGVEEAVAGDPRTDIRIFGKPSARVNRRMGVVVGYEPHGSSLEALRERVCAAAAKVKVTE